MARAQIAAFHRRIDMKCWSGSYEWILDQYWTIPLANGKSIGEGLMNLFDPVESFSQTVALLLILAYSGTE